MINQLTKQSTIYVYIYTYILFFKISAGSEKIVRKNNLSMFIRFPPQERSLKLGQIQM